MPASWERVFDLGELGVTRWLEKPPIPSAVHAQELKTKVVPSGMLLALLDPAIEFVGELNPLPGAPAALELDGTRNTKI